MTAAARHGLHRSRIGVDVRGAVALVGTLFKYVALTPLVPAAVALGYGESPWPFVLTTVIAGALALGLERLARAADEVGAREGFLVVSVVWLLAAALGATPFLLSGEEQFSRPLDAYFEAMSGFTTTGASVVTDFDALPRSLLLWRQLTQWLGGMGIIVLALAVLPRLRVGGRQLFEHELPGPEIEPLASSIRDTARRLWTLYLLLTVVLALTLAIFGWTGVDERMGVFEAWAYALTTLPTGGFGVDGQSVAAFGAASQWVIAFFMAVAGANLALTYRALLRRDPGALGRDEELRLYVLLLTVGSLLIFLDLVENGLFAGEEAVRHAVFQAVSTMTTTGFASADFNEWTFLALVVIVGLMLSGGSAGSTAGSVKVVRHLLIGRILRRELDQTVHPELVSTIRLNGQRVDERTLQAVLAFVLLYVGLFAAGALGLMLDAAFNGPGLRPIDAIAASATSLGNVGPAFGFAGPFGSFEPFSDVSTAIMTVLMWLGRLEIIPVVVLLTRNYWRA